MKYRYMVRIAVTEDGDMIVDCHGFQNVFELRGTIDIAKDVYVDVQAAGHDSPANEMPGVGEERENAGSKVVPLRKPGDKRDI